MYGNKLSHFLHGKPSSNEATLPVGSPFQGYMSYSPQYLLPNPKDVPQIYLSSLVFHNICKALQLSPIWPLLESHTFWITYLETFWLLFLDPWRVSYLGCSSWQFRAFMFLYVPKHSQCLATRWGNGKNVEKSCRVWPNSRSRTFVEFVHI